MIPIHGKPFLEYIIELLKTNGIKEIVILTGYLGDQIERYFQDGKNYGAKITYSNAGVEAGTGLRLKKAQHLLNDKFLLLYGDNYWPLKLPELNKFYKSTNTEALVTVYSNRDGYTTSNMYVDENNLVTSYKKSDAHSHEYNGVDIGFFILKKHHIDLLPTTDSSFEEIIIPKLIRKKQLAGFLTHHRYYGLSNTTRIPNIEKYFKPKKVIFLDRDGVVNKKAPEAEYIKSWEEFELLPYALKSLQPLTKRKYQIYIVTNQAGIARGIMTRKEVDEIHNKLQKLLKKNKVKIHGIYMCPHGWDEGCFCRKPKPGMFFQAASEHALNLFDSICIGDDRRDMMAAKTAGVKGYQVTTGTSFYDIVRSII
jgi:D-glycero-D-manno-heptose 1,7-bisphosphate phosphatase